jgi:hypothetical protein
MRTVLDTFAQIFRSLWTHKVRSFVTMFGVASRFLDRDFQ